jgi:ribosomal protein L40E
MSDVRCRACGAAVPAEAQWCSLCFADLRVPAPARERVSVPVGAESAAEAVAAPAATPSAAQPAGDVILGLPEPTAALTAPDASETEAPETPEEAKWPCLRCGEQVPISFDACHACGAGFLAGSTSQPSVRLPVVGDLGGMSRNQRLALGFGLCLVVMVVLVVLATVGGHLL